MANYLMMGVAGTTWRLPADTDPTRLLDELDEAHASAEVARVLIEMNDDPLNRRELHINPRQLGWWTVLEQPDPS